MAEVRLTVRIPEDTHETIVELSKRELRSLNAQIVMLLREALAARTAKQPSKDERGQA